MILAKTEWKGVDAARKRLEKRQFKLSGKDPAMFGEIQQVVYRSTATNWGSQGRPQWRERKRVYQWPILAKTGKLLDTTLKSIQRQWQHLSNKHLLNITSVFYGLFHQYGLSQVVRRYVNLQPEEKREITTIIKKHLKGE